MTKFLSLKYKLLFLSILISGLLTIFLSIIEIRTDITDYKTLVQNEFLRFKETHLPYLADKIWAMEYTDLKKYTENEVHEQWFDSIRIYDIQGVVIASAGNKTSNSHEAIFDFKYNHNKKDIVIGSVSLSANIPVFWDVIKERWLSVFIMNGLLVFFIFICSYLFLNKLVLSRVQQIISETQDEKRFDRLEGKPVQSKSKFRDEIDLLINALNERSRQLFHELVQRKKTEESLRFQALILDSIQDHVTATDIEGNILYVNKAEMQASKRQSHELLNQSADIYGEDVLRGATQKELIEKTLKFGRWRTEVVNYTADDNELILDCRTQLIRDLKGNPWRLVGISTDITERKRTEAEKELLLTAIEQAAETILITDANGDIQYANKAFEKLTGYYRKDVIGKNPNILKSGSHDTSFYKIMWDTILRGEVWTGEIKNQNKDGDIFIEKATISPVKDSTGSVTNFVAVKHDITEQIKIQNQLAQAQKMESIGSLAGGIAHDFNNILFPIVGLSEMLIEDFSPGSPEHGNAKEILKAGMRGSELVKQILAFSRQNEDKLSPTRLQFVMKEVLKLTRASIPTNIEINQSLDPDCGLVLAESTQLHQIGMNLITNAYHAVQANDGKIDIEVKEKNVDENMDELALPIGRYATLTVADNGVGISREYLEKIFEPYFTTKEKGKGTGLGLSVVYGIVKKHKGDIIVNSEPGQGTSFQVYLPVLNAPDSEMTLSATTLHPTGDERILLIDDEAPIANLQKQMLERLGYSVSTWTSSIDALEKFKANPDTYDMIVSDMSMPQMTGDQLAIEVLKIRPDFPIIICTGFSERIDKEQAYAMGIKGFLMKPVAKADMANEIRRILDEDDSSFKSV